MDHYVNFLFKKKKKLLAKKISQLFSPVKKLVILYMISRRFSLLFSSVQALMEVLL